ncbi:MAG: HAMP domain-containing sensor histidine kinase, partial [Oscillospiraceae bacterium]|nr:HAMP domain-containing sensor histidine kinase [Oscillospiraceae bacterium]
MLKKLQRRFIAIAMVALASLMLFQNMAVNAITIYQRDLDARSILKVIAKNGGVLPNQYIDEYDYLTGFFSPFSDYHIETPYSTRYFVVELHDNIVTRISTEHIAAVDNQTALQYANEAYKGEPGFGFLGVYRYLYTKNGSRSMIVFLDMQKEMKQSTVLLNISFMVSFIALGFLLLFVYLLSKRAMRPVVMAMDKQKQFITDAGHELKTPIAIIKADAEVLELCRGENEWTSSIKNQTDRMTHLVKSLVDLSKLNEMNKETKSWFNISNAVLETAEGFETSAKAAGKHFSYSASGEIRYLGNEQEIRQLISILCDNAIKYTDEGGYIKLIVYKAGKNIQIESYNTCEYVDPNTTEKLFDRFYRGDSSRAREEKTGGYGIGLSIAKAIVDRHHGKIRVVTGGTTS